MKLHILSEHGYEESLLGLSLNKNQPIENMPSVAEKLAFHDGGHNKFLESITVWLDIDAPLYWWSEFDTYRVGVTKQSESTMHTLGKRLLTFEDFELGEDTISSQMLHEFNELIRMYQAMAPSEDRDDLFLVIKRLLPTSFLQRRVVCTNYKTLRNMLLQRAKHRLPEWKFFCGYIATNVEHRELLPEIKL